MANIWGFNLFLLDLSPVLCISNLTLFFVASYYGNKIIRNRFWETIWELIIPTRELLPWKKVNENEVRLRKKTLRKDVRKRPKIKLTRNQSRIILSFVISGVRLKRAVITDLKCSCDVRSIKGAGSPTFNKRVKMNPGCTFEVVFLSFFEIIVWLFQLLK